jgi:hypothetical protein
LVNRSMHAPTIMTLAEIMLKISRSFPSERNRIRMSLQRNNGADVDGLHRMIGEERDPCLAVKDASPDAVDVVTLVDCVHNNVRGKVVWEEVSKVQLGDLSIVPLSNTILATELGLWFGCYSAPASVDMNDIQSISIHETKPSICAISLLSAIDSFGDVSVETATSTVHVALKNPSEAQAFCCDLQNKSELFKKLDDFSRRSAVSKISIASATTATPSSKMHPKTPAALVNSAAIAAHDAATNEPVSVVDAAEDIKASIIPQTLHFSQASAIKTPESAKKTAPAATAPVPKASDKHRQKVAEKPAQATNAELPLAFSLYVQECCRIQCVFVIYSVESHAFADKRATASSCDSLLMARRRSKRIRKVRPATVCFKLFPAAAA